MGRIALCADADSLAHPQLMGLDDVSFEDAEWLALFSKAEEARRGVASSGDIDEVWVVSCDDMEPINLAAALKQDGAERRVFLVSDGMTGSCLSRARSAGLNGALTSEGFCRRYASERRVRRLPDGASHLDFGAEDDVVEEDFLSVGCDACKASSTDGIVAGAASSEELPGVRGGFPAAFSGESSSPRFPASFRATKGAGCLEALDACGSVVLVVTSAGGGAGKSAFSALAASALARQGMKTLLVDGDFANGDSALVSGEKNPVHFDELLHDDEICPDGGLLDALTSCSAGYAVVAAPERIEVGEAVRLLLPQAVDAFSRRFEAVVVNADSCWDELKVALLERSTHAVCLVDQRMSSVRLSQRIMSLCARCGVAATSLEFALNKTSKEALLSTIDVSCALQGARVFDLAYGGRVVEELLGMGMPRALFDEGNAFCESVEGLLSQLIPEAFVRSSSSSEGKKRRRGFFGQGLSRMRAVSGEEGDGFGYRAS